MPKIKTKRAAAKRFRVTKTGKVVRRHAFTSHILTKKSQKENAISGRALWSPRARSEVSSACWGWVRSKKTKVKQVVITRR